MATREHCTTTVLNSFASKDGSNTICGRTIIEKLCSMKNLSPWHMYNILRLLNFLMNHDD